jgi:serine/threonine-protein kinase
MPAFAGVDLEAETPLPAAAPPPTAPAPSPPSREGTRRALPSLPGYELEKKLGEGQMGAVYKGRETASGRTVAVKLLPPHLAANREYIARFDREAQAAMRLQHPNIVQGIACGEAGGFHYFVMEFVEGESLEARIKRDRKVPERDALEVALGVAAALECAAREGIVHRDLKPANILVGTGGQVKVVDLGLAKNVDDEKKQQPALTRVGIILGSPYYLAPEQAATQKVDARSDLYSLGATLYHLVTGSVPFDGQDPIEILENLLSSPPPDPRRRAPDLSEAFSRAITKLMAKRPDARFQTPTELRLELLRIREDSSRGGTLRWIKRLLTGR